MRSRHTGFTLLELIVVITILGLLTAMVAPFGAHLDNQARRAATDQAFEAIRAAILGPRGQTDAMGRPVIGGYVGDMGHLPPLYEYIWENSKEKWETVPKTEASETFLVKADAFNSEAPANFKEFSHAQPMGLWTNATYSLEDSEECDEAWKGPYLSTPRDKYPEDNAFTYDAPADTPAKEANNRLFLLRETEGRLSDGWGLAFIILSEDVDEDTGIPKSLVFISPGQDGEYDPEDENFATGIDYEESVNEDNILYRITEHEYANHAVKTDQTRSQLLALHDAIVGPRRDSQGRQVPPSGYSADVGGLETLFGSVVRHENYLWLCTKDTSNAEPSIAGSDSDEWKRITNNANTDFPKIPLWRAGVLYTAPRPYLLHSNKGAVVFGSDNENVWKCIGTTGGGSCPATIDIGHGWLRQPDLNFPKLEFVHTSIATGAALRSFETQDDVASWAPQTTNIDDDYLNAWKMDTSSNKPPLAYGWRGGYLPPGITASAPLWMDAWKKRIIVRQDADRNIHLVSVGPNGKSDYQTSIDGEDDFDDIIVTIFQGEYEQPVTSLIVSVGGVTPTADSIVDIWAPRNGQLNVWRDWSEASPFTTYKFETAASPSNVGFPLSPGETGYPSDITSALCTAPCSTDITNPTYKLQLSGMLIPAGRIYVVFRENADTAPAASKPDTLYPLSNGAITLP